MPALAKRAPRRETSKGPTSKTSKTNKTSRTSKSATSAATKPRARAAAETYDAPKQFEGQRYTGMAVGRSHKWKYDQGEWRERKVTPDRWTFSYSVAKRRAGRAPEGSGAPVGTGYYWFILADQVVTKLDANTYSTAMSGEKFKLAHKRAGAAKWSASDAARRRRLIALLKRMLHELETAPTAAPPPPA